MSPISRTTPPQKKRKQHLKNQGCPYVSLYENETHVPFTAWSINKGYILQRFPPIQCITYNILRLSILFDAGKETLYKMIKYGSLEMHFLEQVFYKMNPGTVFYRRKAYPFNRGTTNGYVFVIKSRFHLQFVYWDRPEETHFYGVKDKTVPFQLRFLPCCRGGVAAQNILYDFKPRRSHIAVGTIHFENKYCQEKEPQTNKNLHW